MSWKSSYRGSITNKKNIYGVMGGLAKGRMSGASGNRATNKLVIPRGAAKGLAYMQMHGILSRNPQSGGVGKVVKSKPFNCKGLGKTAADGGGGGGGGTDANPREYSLFRQAGCSDAGGKYPDWSDTEDFSDVAAFCNTKNCAAIEGNLTGTAYDGKYVYTPYSSIGGLAVNSSTKQCIVAALPDAVFPAEVNMKNPGSFPPNAPPMSTDVLSTNCAGNQTGTCGQPGHNSIWVGGEYYMNQNTGCGSAVGAGTSAFVNDFSRAVDWCNKNTCLAIEGVKNGNHGWKYTPYSSIGSLAINQTNKQCIVAPLPGIRFPSNVNEDCLTSRVGSCTSCKYPAVILGQSDLDNSGSLMNY